MSPQDVQPKPQPQLDTHSQTGLTTWDIVVRILRNWWARAALIVIGLVCVVGLLTGRISFEFGQQGLTIGGRNVESSSEISRFEGEWHWTGQNLVPGKPYEYKGVLTLKAKRGRIEGEGEYSIVRGPPIIPPPRRITVDGVPNGEYLEVRYEVRAIGVPASRGFGFMLLHVKPNGVEMEGHFLTRSLLDDGFVWGMVNFRK
jgi:hypothetical protein